MRMNILLEDDAKSVILTKTQKSQLRRAMEILRGIGHIDVYANKVAESLKVYVKMDKITERKNEQSEQKEELEINDSK